MKTIESTTVFADNIPYETELLKIALYRHNWDVKVKYFTNAQKALEYLKATHEPTFLIISAMQMPGMSDMEFKRTRPMIWISYFSTGRSACNPNPAAHRRLPKTN